MKKPMQVFYSDELLKFAGRFPDVPERLAAITEYLENSDLKYKLVKPIAAKRKELERVHEKKYLDEIEKYKRINAYFPDEPIDENTFNIACISAGAAIGAAESAIKTGEFSFGLTRPKGNHAGKDFFGGYSYINNVAVAVSKAIEEKRAKKALIVDMDAHFCNGTNNIFVNNEKVGLISLHQYADSVYPYVGKEKESTGRMRYYENQLWITDKEYVDKFREVVGSFIDEFQPDLIAVSAGFNTFHKDMFFGTVSKIKQPRTYHKLGRVLKMKANQVDANIFGVLEGGYWIDELGELVYNFLKGFQEDGLDLPDVVNEDPTLNSKKQKKRG
jgi:acetoin utilization deacetylase AcuC-like enzyme